MGPKGGVAREVKSALRLPEETSKLRRYPVVGHQKAVIVTHGDHVTVEKPVRGCGQGKAVLDNVWSIIGNRSDMCRLNLGPAPAIDNAKSRDGTSVIVSLANLEAEIRVADLSVDEKLFGRPRVVGFLQREGRKPEL